MRIYDIPDGRDGPQKLWLDGKPAPLREATVSAVPFNRRWPGYQRQRSQTEPVWFANFETEGPVSVRYAPGKPFEEVIIRPLSKRIMPAVHGDEIAFTLPGPGFYTVEVDGQHSALHLFADPPIAYDVDMQDPNTLYFGKGLHEVGMLQLKSGQTVFIDEGAVVYACIHAKGVDNIRILGRGVLDNSHNVEEILWEATADMAEQEGFAVTNANRIHTVQLEYCNDVRIEGITIRDSLIYNIRPIGCEDLSIAQVKIIGCWRYNSDGIDMHNCRRAHISDCFVRTYDDSICVKGFDYTQDEADMRACGRDCTVMEDILVERCVIWCDWGRCLEIGAETRAEEITRITFRDCDIIHASAVVLDVQNVDYADVHDVRFEDIRVEYDGENLRPKIQVSDAETYPFDPDDDYLPNLMASIVTMIPEYSAGGTRRGKNRDIYFTDIQVSGPRMPGSFFRGYDEAHQSSAIRIQNLTFNGKRIKTLEEANVTIGPNASDITIT